MRLREGLPLLVVLRYETDFNENMRGLLIGHLLTTIMHRGGPQNEGKINDGT